MGRVRINGLGVRTKISAKASLFMALHQVVPSYVDYRGQHDS
jgi:hypothetical protein